MISSGKWGMPGAARRTGYGCEMLEGALSSFLVGDSIFSSRIFSS